MGNFVTSIVACGFVVPNVWRLFPSAPDGLLPKDDNDFKWEGEDELGKAIETLEESLAIEGFGIEKIPCDTESTSYRYCSFFIYSKEESTEQHAEVGSIYYYGATIKKLNYPNTLTDKQKQKIKSIIDRYIEVNSALADDAAWYSFLYWI